MGDSMHYVLLFLALAVAGLFLLRRRLLARLLRLPPPQHAVGVERAIPVPMPDGIHLLTDHYWPKVDGDHPTILIRTPYGRGKEVFLLGGYPLGELPAQRFAERGYHVIVQGTRGRYESEGDFEPHLNEAADGQATVAWIGRQPWFDGRLAAWGPSYLGYTLWAAATTVRPQLRAIVPINTSSENYSVTHPEGAFGLETRLRWSQGLVRTNQLHRRPFWDKVHQRFFGKDEQALLAAYMHLPMREADWVATGRPVPFLRNMLTHSLSDDPYWLARDHSTTVCEVEASAHLIGGWHDYYLRGLLRDFAALKAAGRNPYLTIGPWHHASAHGLTAGLREAVTWFDAHLKDSAKGIERQPVRLFVMGAEEWREMAEFPPSFRPARYFLREGGGLATEEPDLEWPPDTFTYNPADPTPAWGGALLAFKGAGSIDNRPLEARPDVLCYSSAPLSEELVIIGPVSLRLYVRSSLCNTDFYGRLCDVYPDGRSMNICDGLHRVRPEVDRIAREGASLITIDMGATAYCFQPGHRLRLQVSSGAHPRWSRNLGSGELDGIDSDMVTAEQIVYHDRRRSSTLIIPVVANM